MDEFHCAAYGVTREIWEEAQMIVSGSDVEGLEDGRLDELLTYVLSALDRNPNRD